MMLIINSSAKGQSPVRFTPSTIRKPFRMKQMYQGKKRLPVHISLFRFVMHSESSHRRKCPKVHDGITGVQETTDTQQLGSHIELLSKQPWVWTTIKLSQN